MVCLLKDAQNTLYDSQNKCSLDTETHKKTIELSIQTPIMSYRDGIGCAGPHGTKIDNDSFLKYNSMLTNYGGKTHLPHVGMLTVPYMGCGIPSTKYVQRPEFEYTYAPKSTLNKGVRNRFVPMVGNLATEIQNPIHIIPEDNDSKWVRGGFPSRKCKYFKQSL